MGVADALRMGQFADNVLPRGSPYVPRKDVRHHMNPPLAMAHHFGRQEQEKRPSWHQAAGTGDHSHVILS